MAADGRTLWFQDGKYDPIVPMLAVSLALHFAAFVGLAAFAKFWGRPASVNIRQESYVVHFIDPGEFPGAPGTGKSAIVETAPPPSEPPGKSSAPVEKKIIPVTKGPAREIKKVSVVKKKIVAEETQSSLREAREVKKLKVRSEAPKKMAEAVGKEIRERKGGGAVDIQKFPYDWYLGIMESKVFGNWDALQVNMSALKNAKVVVLFSIDRSGKIVKSKIEESSDDAEIDKSALEAVGKSAPFAPLPEGYKEETLDVHFGFNISPK
ncbi:MAG: TonB family protein [Nitrospinae bacterium]|nr:TonB family protein [Nitrospinota bacterium]